jgi:phospholipid/cholesterol/gamma-HCH transport system substrate-binding protein
MVLIFLGMAYFTIILSREAWLTKKYPVEVMFTHVMGLREGDNVVVRGMPVGKVKALKLEQGDVRVILSLDQPVYLRTDYVVTIVATSILGGRYLEIKEGSRERPPLPEGNLVRGRDPHDLLGDATEIFSALKHSLIEEGTLDNFRAVSAQLKDIATRVGQGKGTVGKLLSEDSKMYDDLAAAVTSLKDVAGRLERGEGPLGKLLSKDSALVDDLSATAASAKTIAARLEKGEGALGKLLSKDSPVGDDLAATVASLKNITARLEKGEGALGKLLSSDDQLYKDLQAAVASLRSVSEGLQKGEGTLGKLLKDESLYNDARSVLRETRAAVDDFREMSPVVNFTSIFFGAL